MTDQEIGWTAGVVDGEGCIALYRHSQSGKKGFSYYLSVKVSQVDARLPRRLQEMWGGRFRPQSWQKRPVHHRQAWEWTVDGEAARDLLRAILPLLVVKKEQAEVALEFEGGYQFSGRPLPEEEKMRRENIRYRLAVLKRVI